AVLAAAPLPTLHAHRVERPPHDVVAHAGQVLDASATDQHDRVLLQVVSHPGDVGRHLDSVREPHAGHLAQRRVRLLGRRREHPHAHAPFLGGSLKSRAVGLRLELLPTDPDELADRGQFEPPTPTGTLAGDPTAGQPYEFTRVSTPVKGYARMSPWIVIEGPAKR